MSQASKPFTGVLQILRRTGAPLSGLEMDLKDYTPAMTLPAEEFDNIKDVSLWYNNLMRSQGKPPLREGDLISVFTKAEGGGRFVSTTVMLDASTMRNAPWLSHVRKAVPNAGKGQNLKMCAVTIPNPVSFVQ